MAPSWWLFDGTILLGVLVAPSWWQHHQWAAGGKKGFFPWPTSPLCACNVKCNLQIQVLFLADTLLKVFRKKLFNRKQCGPLTAFCDVPPNVYGPGALLEQYFTLKHTVVVATQDRCLASWAMAPTTDTKDQNHRFFLLEGQNLSSRDSKWKGFFCFKLVWECSILTCDFSPHIFFTCLCACITLCVEQLVTLGKGNDQTWPAQKGLTSHNHNSPQWHVMKSQNTNVLKAGSKYYGPAIELYHIPSHKTQTQV